MRLTAIQSTCKKRQVFVSARRTARMSGDTGLSQQLCDFDLDDDGGVELTEQEAEEGARAYDEAQRLVCQQYSRHP